MTRAEYALSTSYCTVKICQKMSEKPAGYEQGEADAKLRMEGLKVNYAEELVAQCQGPMPKFVAPHGLSRRSRFPLFRKSLKRHVTVEEVDFKSIFEALEGAEDYDDDIEDVLALGVLATIR